MATTCRSNLTLAFVSDFFTTGSVKNAKSIADFWSNGSAWNAALETNAFRYDCLLAPTPTRYSARTGVGTPIFVRDSANVFRKNSIRSLKRATGTPLRGSTGGAQLVSMKAINADVSTAITGQ